MLEIIVLLLRPFSLSLQCGELQCTAMKCNVLQVESCKTMFQNNQDLSLQSGSDILDIFGPAERVRYDILINRRYIHKRWPALIFSDLLSLSPVAGSSTEPDDGFDDVVDNSMYTSVLAVLDMSPTGLSGSQLTER